MNYIILLLILLLILNLNQWKNLLFLILVIDIQKNYKKE